MEAIRKGLAGWLRGDHTLSEGALLARAQRGERTAFDGLVAHHMVPLRGFLRRRLPNDAVEDVIQETFLAAWSALPGFEPRVRFKTWLYRIALYKAVDWQRRLTRNISLDQLSWEPVGTLQSTDNALAVQALLAQLSDDQRLILELYYFDDLTLAEVALVLDRNLSTVKYHFYQAHTHGLRLLQEGETG